MSNYTPTISELREAWLSAEFDERGPSTSDDDLRAEFDRALAVHDAEVLSVERERIIQEMQERSHPDDWGVPCIYVSSYAKRLRSENA